jgi:hypothetical protein
MRAIAVEGPAVKGVPMIDRIVSPLEGPFDPFLDRSRFFTRFIQKEDLLTAMMHMNLSRALAIF